MTRQAVSVAENIPNMPILEEHDSVSRVGVLLVTGDRGLAGAFNSQIVRAGLRAGREYEGDGRSLLYSAVGRRGVSTLTFRGKEPVGRYVGFTDRPAYADAREAAVPGDEQQRDGLLGLVLLEDRQRRDLAPGGLGGLARHPPDRSRIRPQGLDALLGAAQTSRRHHLHGAGDLLDVLDRTDAVLDVALSCAHREDLPSESAQGTVEQ
jgi:hypothetical protein